MNDLTARRVYRLRQMPVDTDDQFTRIVALIEHIKKAGDLSPYEVLALQVETAYRHYVANAESPTREVGCSHQHVARI